MSYDYELPLFCDNTAGHAKRHPRAYIGKFVRDDGHWYLLPHKAKPLEGQRTSKTRKTTQAGFVESEDPLPITDLTHHPACPSCRFEQKWNRDTIDPILERIADAPEVERVTIQQLTAIVNSSNR